MHFGERIMCLEGEPEADSLIIKDHDALGKTTLSISPFPW